MDHCAALCMMIMASIFLSGLGWVQLLGWVGLDDRKWTHVHVWHKVYRVNLQHNDYRFTRLTYILLLHYLGEYQFDAYIFQQDSPLAQHARHTPALHNKLFSSRKAKTTGSKNAGCRSPRSWDLFETGFDGGKTNVRNVWTTDHPT